MPPPYPPPPLWPSRPGEAIAVLSMHTSPLGQLGRGENGGMNLFVRRLCTELAERGIPSDVYVRRDDPSLPSEELITSTSRLVRVTAGPPRRLPKQELVAWVPRFTAEVQAHAASEGREYRLIHSHYWLSGWAARGLVQRWRIPWVQSFHSLASMKSAAGLPPDPAREHAEAVIARAADRLVAVSAAEQRALVESCGAAPERVCVVPPGVDRQLYGPRPLGVRTRLGVGSAPVVLCAGRLEPLKGADTLLEAIGVLARAQRCDDAVVLVAGEDSGDGERQGGERGRLESLAARLGLRERVRFLGAVPHAELADLYALADVCVVPSHTESFGLVALEAQASGTPVVAAAVGGLRDVVDDGVTGILVEGRDPAAFGAAIADVLEDPERRRRMGAAARERAGRFTWELSADRLVTLYRCVEAPEPAAALEQCGCL